MLSIFGRRWTLALRKEEERDGGGNWSLSQAVANLPSQHVEFTTDELALEPLLTARRSLSPRSYVHPRARSPAPHAPTAYLQPPQKTAQLWNKSKDELAAQLADLKSYVAPHTNRRAHALAGIAG